MASLKSILQSLTQRATLGQSTHQFLDKLDAKLGDNPSKTEFDAAVGNTLRLRRFRKLNPGLRALAEAAWLEKGPDGIKCYLAQQSEIAEDVDTRDRWNRDVRKKLGPVLQAVVRPGKKELSTADTVQAFALEHGLPLLEETIKDRYEAPKVEDPAQWSAEVRAALQAELEKWPDWEVPIEMEKVEALTTNLTDTFDSWLAMPQPQQQKVWDKMQTLMTDLREQPKEVLLGSLREAAVALNRVPTEANLVATTAISLVIAAKIGVAVTSLPMAIGVTAAVLIGWLMADAGGAVFHWDKDNYPKGRVGREFVDHHYNPKAVSEWPLRRNAEGLDRPMLLALAATAFLPGGALPAFLMTLFKGALYTQQAHGYAHANPKDVPKFIGMLQKTPLLPVLLTPRQHLREHHGGRPLGKEAYGVLNGWSNYITDKTEFFRILEEVREQITGETPNWQREAEVRKVAQERKKQGVRSTIDC